MILLRRALADAGIRVDPDTTDDKEEVCCDLSVGDIYMQAGESELLTLTESLLLNPGRCIVAYTAERITVPKGYFGTLCSKGSLANRGMLVPNTKIDPLYCDVLKIAVFNAGQRVLSLDRGMKFCSIVFHQLDGEAYGLTRRSGPNVSNEPPSTWVRRAARFFGI